MASSYCLKQFILKNTSRVPAALSLTDQIVSVNWIKQPAGRAAKPAMAWRKNYQAPLMALLTALQAEGKLDATFHPSIEQKSKDGPGRMVYLNKPPGQSSHPFAASIA